ncbi:citrate synthase [Pajaroellobacter abortibovis]|uniref:Citrate synthase n=1 Tax=Pajaroellobacter abortibovis TaxID=1882918 RepID=A0A1L6MV46_9BACT|nr:citrate synthase [Pajaroellobacter abortibovis]APR99325.1 citrate (Si)-synthase [Pajaroellobacter abortibovis]
MSEQAKILIGHQTLQVPLVTGTEGEKAIDISNLRSTTGCVTLDPAFMNTASTKSDITFIDGDKGILRYRGIPIEQLAEKSNFMETAYLLIYGKLPTASELEAFSTLLTRHSLLHEDMKLFFDGLPSTAHPMATLSSMVLSLSSFYPESRAIDNKEVIDMTIARLISKLSTIAAFAYKKSIGQPFVYPNNSLSYCANFLNMMFSLPTEEYIIDEEMVSTLNLLLILHTDHEQNCSTSTVRLVGSSKANLFACIAAGMCALWGPLHGGANQEVLEMLERIYQDGGNVKKYVAMAKDKNNDFLLMGFGHRVYKYFDPRAKIIKQASDRILSKFGIHDPLLDIAKQLEETALHDPYFIERKLYPNVDFYSGIIYRAMGIPTNMFTVMFAIGRLPGWIAHWKEMTENPSTRISRPRQIYTGSQERLYIPIEQRKD